MTAWRYRTRVEAREKQMVVTKDEIFNNIHKPPKPETEWGTYQRLGNDSKLDRTKILLVDFPVLLYLAK